MRLPRPDAVLVQAAIAGALSFAHLHDIAGAANQQGWKAWAYPVSVDLLLVAAWRRMRVLRSTGQNSRAAWAWFAIALTASLGANVATAGLLDLNHVPAWLRILVAGWPALAFFGGTLLAHIPAAPAALPVEPEPELPLYETEFAPPPAPVTEVAPEPEAVEAPAPAPALPAASARTTPAVAVPAALIEHARKVADDHLTRTGAPIDSDTLRTRLGVPPHFADAIAAQLA